MKKNNFKKIANQVIEIETNSLKKLKQTININFDKAVEKILNRKNGKVIFSGIGKSGYAGALISSTFSSVGIPSFFIDANDASHGSLGAIEKNDILILISNSGKTIELENIINFCKRRRITLIGIMSKKNSILYKAAEIKLLIPEVKEADPNSIVPTSSTLIALSLGHCLAVATMKYKKFDKKSFKLNHPGGNLGQQLKTVEDIMLVGSKIPFVKENLIMKDALKVILKKKLGILIVRNKKNLTKGIVTDGDIKRSSQANQNLSLLNVKEVMTKNPISVEKNTLLSESLSIMSNKKITSLCIFDKKNKKKTIGVVHIHNILKANIQ